MSSNSGMLEIGGHFEVHHNEQASSGKAIMNDFEKWNVKVMSPQPDTPRLMNIFQQRNQRYIHIDIQNT